MQETQETWVWSPGQEDPQEKEMLLTPVFLAGELHEERSLAGYSPWGHKSRTWLGDYYITYDFNNSYKKLYIKYINPFVIFYILYRLTLLIKCPVLSWCTAFNFYVVKLVPNFLLWYLFFLWSFFNQNIFDIYHCICSKLFNLLSLETSPSTD